MTMMAYIKYWLLPVRFGNIDLFRWLQYAKFGTYFFTFPTGDSSLQ